MTPAPPFGLHSQEQWTLQTGSPRLGADMAMPGPGLGPLAVLVTHECAQAPPYSWTLSWGSQEPGLSRGCVLVLTWLSSPLLSIWSPQVGLGFALGKHRANCEK